MLDSPIHPRIEEALAAHKNASEHYMRCLDAECIEAAEFAEAERSYTFLLTTFEGDAWANAVGSNAETRKAHVAAVITEAQHAGELRYPCAAMLNHRSKLERSRYDVAIAKIALASASEQLRTLTAALALTPQYA